ncbi:MAG TPA: YkgJ family cysteine cluster protein [Flavipsychrobacter sp.]
MLPQNWQQQAADNRKAYKRLLEKGNKNKILKALPDLHEEAFEQIDCLQCANCCKNYSPRFKNPDIKRIAKLLRMKEGEFTATYLRLDEDNDYVLKQQPCPFLAEDNTCNIYEDRPSDCRRYPYTDEDVLIKRVPLTLKNSTSCPITFHVLERLREMEQK